MSYFFAFNEIKSVTASSEDLFYPASNLLEHPTYKEYRAASTSATLTLDLGAFVSCDSLLLCGNNATRDLQVTSIRLEGNTTNSWTAPAFTLNHDVTLDGQLNNLVYVPFIAKAFRYWRLTVNNPGGLYVGFSNLFLGAKTDLPVDVGYTFTLADRSEISGGRYSQRFIDKLPDLRYFSCSMSAMNQPERDALAAIAHRCSTHTPLWMILNPGTSLEEAGYFYFDKAPQIENQAYQLYSTSLDMTEAI